MEAALGDREWDIVISDYVLPGFSGIAALGLLKKAGLDLPFIIVSGNIGEDIAVAAMRAGAHDYIMKDNLKRLVPAVERELREAEVRRGRRNAQEAIEFTHRLLQIANRQAKLAPLLRDIVEEIRKFSGCEAVGLRLLDPHGKIPYEAWLGFPDEFYRLESPLSIQSDECMCINVIKGTADAKQPFYTPGGSFYVNVTTRFLATVSEEDKGHTRNVCNRFGYESVALIPIRVEGQTIGALHIADTREGRVPRRIVEILEEAALQLGMAIRRLRVEENLRKASDELSHLAAAVEQASESVIIADREAVIWYANPAFEVINGFGRPEALGKSYLDFVSDRPLQSQIRDALRHGRECQGRLRRIRKDGAERDLTIAVSPVKDAEGKALNFLAIERDVTEEIRLQQITRQQQKMEALGTLAGGIAHDFNNILTAIMINTEMALYDAEKKAAVPDYLPAVLEAANRGKELVKQVLAFSRKREQELRAVKLSPVIREALGFLRASLPKTIEIRSSISTKFDVAMADATQVHQVLINLGSNAAHAMRERAGVLEVSLSPVEVDARLAARDPDLKPGPYVRLTVKDTGTGIPPEVLPKIFDPFFTTKPPEEGTGMGLSVVHGIVKSLDGTITVETEMGKGTTFSVFLPRVLEDVEQGRAALGPIAGGNERILVVDDEALQAQTLQIMLERLGYRVVAESESLKALEVFRSDPGAFDLVLTDQEMPRFSGAKLAEAVLRLRPDIPVILCTGYSETVDEETAKALGIRLFLMKPYSVRELAEAARAAIDGAAAR